jgi:hypothetical protein
MGPPSESVLELIRAAVGDPAILDEREPFVWSAQASNVQEDAYATVMDRSTLDNFAADAIVGVAFMNSHRTGGFSPAELPLGRTIDGKVVGASGAGPTRLDVTSYLLRGVDLTALPTEQFINGLRSGIARDVSVGFYGGEYRCSIDGKDMRTDYTCPHYPGLSYPAVTTKGEATGETVRATARIVGAHLAELSSVFDGATPGCMVYKATRMVEAGQIRGDTIDLLERRLRVKLPSAGRVYPSAVPRAAALAASSEGEPGMTKLTDADVTTLRTALADAGVTLAEDSEIPASTRLLVDELLPLRALPEKLTAAEQRVADAEVRAIKHEREAETLRPLADLGRQYQTDLLEQAVLEGKRAMGDAFAEATYRATLAVLPLESVKQMRDDWKRQGDAVFAGGRLTVETSQRNGAAAAAGGIPDAAYKTGR